MVLVIRRVVVVAVVTVVTVVAVVTVVVVVVFTFFALLAPLWWRRKLMPATAIAFTVIVAVQNTTTWANVQPHTVIFVVGKERTRRCDVVGHH